MENAKDFRMVFMTIDSYSEAEKIAYSLVEEKLAACCNIIDKVTSIYSWENEVVSDNEYLVLIKTSSKKIKKMEERIKELHSYDVPEIISISLEEGSQDYLKWMNGVLK